MQESELKRKVNSIRTNLMNSLNLSEFELLPGTNVLGKKTIMGYEYLGYVDTYFNHYKNTFQFDWVIVKRFNLIENNLNLALANSIHRSINAETCDIRSIYASQKLIEPYYEKNILNFQANEKGIQIFKDISAQLLNGNLFPFSEKMNNIHFLNEFYNSEVKSDKLKSLYGTWLKGFKRVVISKLSNNDNLEIAMENLSISHSNYKSELQKQNPSQNSIKFMNHYTDFLQEIEKLEPLENPDLFSEDNLKYLNT